MIKLAQELDLVVHVDNFSFQQKLGQVGKKHIGGKGRVEGQRRIRGKDAVLAQNPCDAEGQTAVGNWLEHQAARHAFTFELVALGAEVDKGVRGVSRAVPVEADTSVISNVEFVFQRRGPQVKGSIGEDPHEMTGNHAAFGGDAAAAAVLKGDKERTVNGGLQMGSVVEGTVPVAETGMVAARADLKLVIESVGHQDALQVDSGVLAVELNDVLAHKAQMVAVASHDMKVRLADVKAVGLGEGARGSEQPVFGVPIQVEMKPQLVLVDLLELLAGGLLNGGQLFFQLLDPFGKGLGRGLCRRGIIFLRLGGEAH